MESLNVESKIFVKYAELIEHEILKYIMPFKLRECYDAWYKYSSLENRFTGISYGAKIAALHSYIDQIFDLLLPYNQYPLVLSLIHAMGLLEDPQHTEIFNTLTKVSRHSIDDSIGKTLIDLLISDDIDKPTKILEILRGLSKEDVNVDIVTIIVRHLDYDIEASAFRSSIYTAEFKIVLFDHSSDVNLDNLLTNIYNGIIDRRSILQLKTLMFRIGDEIKYYNGYNIVNFSEPINSRRKIWFESVCYTVREFLLVHLFIYNGMVDEEGPDVIIKNDKYYVNIRNFTAKVLIGPRDQDKTIIIKSFVENIVQYRFKGIKPDLIFTSDNIYRIYITYCKTFSVKHEGKNTFFKLLSNHYTDVSNKHKGEVTTPHLYTLVKSNFSESNNVCYYVYNGTTPKGTRKILSVADQVQDSLCEVESKH